SAAITETGNFSLVKVTPTHLEMLNQQLSAATMGQACRVLIIGGEALAAERLEMWRKHGGQTRLINEYGPTETVVGCSVYEVRAEDEHSGGVAIGRAIANTQMYVLDAGQEVVAIGVSGELYIGGAGVARGYLNSAKQTAEKFVPDGLSGRSGAR